MLLQKETLNKTKNQREEKKKTKQMEEFLYVYVCVSI